MRFEKMNQFAPQHSRIFKEMILVISPSKPFAYTVKMTPRRKAIVQDYEPEIAALYAAIQETSQIEAKRPVAWSMKETTIFVRGIVEQTLKTAISPEANLFVYGCDSLQSIWIRNSVLRVLRETSPQAAKAISPSFVYDHPTVNDIATYLVKAINGPGAKHDVDLNARAEELEAVVDKYLEGLPERASADPVTNRHIPSKQEVYLVTGTTGCVGSNILAQLLASESVSQVFALNRLVAGTAPLDRHREVFKFRGLEATLLESAKLTLLEGELSAPLFGLTQEVYEQLHVSVTHIIHNAWKINMNLPLVSFDSLVLGTRNLAAFSLTSPRQRAPSVLLVSSIGVFSHADRAGPMQETELASARTAAGSGYSASKWLAERILDHASKAWGLPTAVARLGQVAGDLRGNWTETEWFPALVQSGERTGCLPLLEGDISWLLASDAAAAFIALARAPLTSAHARVFHVVNPRTAPIRPLMEHIAKETGAPLVPYADWFAALERLDAHTTPAVRLLEFYRAPLLRAEHGWEPIGVPHLGCSKAVQTAPVLAEAKVVGEMETSAWVERWRESGFLNITLTA